MLIYNLNKSILKEGSYNHRYIYNYFIKSDDYLFKDLLYDNLKIYYYFETHYIVIFSPTMKVKNQYDYIVGFKLYVGNFYSFRYEYLIPMTNMLKTDALLINDTKFNHPWKYQDKIELRKHKLKKIL